jgi:GTP:adenosylcobinamide-phosphate guanylyltransferase
MNEYPGYIIIQAGGRGSRLRHHTWNKPKCLVSVRGKPLLYHLFDRFPTAKFLIIGDYAFEQLEKYLEMNRPAVAYNLIKARDYGTAGGLNEALNNVPLSANFMLIWSDLIVSELPKQIKKELPVVFTTSAFTCRWTVNTTGAMVEEPSGTCGIPGMFYFPDKSSLSGLPDGGEFVKWLSKNLEEFITIDCPKLEELGDFLSIERENDIAGFSRFFNKVEILKDSVIKSAIDKDYEKLIEGEKAWYRAASELGFRRIPQVISEEPFTLERINGEHLFKITDLTKREQRAVFADYIDTLLSLHDKATAQTDLRDVEDVYIKKTISRVESVSSIIPGFDRDTITINGRKCRNIFAEKYRHLIDDVMEHITPRNFTPIHGDPTFSNTLVDDKLRTWFIDPRGYFAKKGILGDPNYDFAKVYYSAVGGYDSFNRRKFKLHIDLETVEVLYEEPTFSASAQEVFASYFSASLPKIEILHSLIWLALSGYAKDDIDSVIGSFYLGLYWFEHGSKRL